MLSGAAANALAAEIDPRSLLADDRADGKWNAKNIRDDAVLFYVKFLWNFLFSL